MNKRTMTHPSPIKIVRTDPPAFPVRCAVLEAAALEDVTAVSVSDAE